MMSFPSNSIIVTTTKSVAVAVAAIITNTTTIQGQRIQRRQRIQQHQQQFVQCCCGFPCRCSSNNNNNNNTKNNHQQRYYHHHHHHDQTLQQNVVSYPIGMDERTRQLAYDLLLRNDSKNSSTIDNSDRKSSTGSTTGSSIDNDHDHDSNSNDENDIIKTDSTYWKRRIALSKTITLIESNNVYDNEQASLLLTYLLSKSKSSSTSTSNSSNNNNDSYFRVGIAGPPGAGKSTLIESLGQYVINLGTSSTENDNYDKNDNTTGTSTSSENNKNTNNTIWKPGTVSVVCIDPSSVTTGGSILGDKTRMNTLSTNYKAFVRPSPTKGSIGGLAPRTDDVIRLIGLSQSYPLLLIETVGVGQSEIEISYCVDMILLLIPPASGDSLQGIKKGIVEIANTIVITKADSNLLHTAQITATEYRSAMQFLNLVTTDDNNHDNDCSSNKQTTPIILVSSITGNGIKELWENISIYRNECIKNNSLYTKRQEQNKYWMYKNLNTLVQEQFTNANNNNNDKCTKQQNISNTILQQLQDNIIPPRVAATLLLSNYTHNTQHLK